MLYNIFDLQKKILLSCNKKNSISSLSSVEDFENQITSDNLYHSINVNENTSKNSSDSLYDSYHLSEDENSEISQFSKYSFFNVGKELLKKNEIHKSK